LGKLLAGIDATKPTWRPQATGNRKTEDGKFIEPLHDTDVTGPFGAEGQDTTSPPASDDALMISDDPNCWLPAKAAVTGTWAILAKKSSGKTYLGMVIAEEFLRLSAKTGVPFPFIVIDPTGVWHGLCATTEGLASPHQILRLGGLRGDFQLNPDQGSVVAQIAIDLWPHPIILDISEMLPEEQHQFAADFGAKFYTINRKPVHLFIDEADDYIPQRTESGNKVQGRCLGVFDRIVRRGRVKGIGVTLITQRPAVINKNVLSQVAGAYLLHVDGPHDLEAIESWMRSSVGTSDRNLCLQALSTLPVGEAFLLQSHLKAGALIKFKTRKKTTFDSSRTPTVDDPDPIPPTLSKIDEDLWCKVGDILEDDVVHIKDDPRTVLEGTAGVVHGASGEVIGTTVKTPREHQALQANEEFDEQAPPLPLLEYDEDFGSRDDGEEG